MYPKPAEPPPEDEGISTVFLTGLPLDRADFRIGPPGPSENPDLDIVDLCPPEWLHRILLVADGIGPWHDGEWSTNALLPWSECALATRYIRFGEENLTWDPGSAVVIHRDAAGGGHLVLGHDGRTLRSFSGATHEVGRPLKPASWLRDLRASWGFPTAHLRG